MLNLIKKYRKILFTLMIMFISSFLGVKNVDAATALNSGTCTISAAGDYYLNADYTCEEFRVTASATLDLKGHELKLTKYMTVYYGSDFTINDSVGGATVTRAYVGQNLRYNTVYLLSSSKLTVNGGTFSNKSSLDAVFAVLNGATLTMNAGSRIDMSYSDISASTSTQDSSRDPLISVGPTASGSLGCSTGGKVILNGGYYYNSISGGAVVGGSSSCNSTPTSNITISPNVTIASAAALTKNTSGTPLGEYSVNYYDGSTKLKTETRNFGTTKSLSYTPTKTGYTFEGWYTDTSYTTATTSVAPRKVGDVSVYAKWTANTYNITYYYGSTKLTNLTPTSYTYGTSKTLPTYAKTGYTFEGWYTDTTYKTKVSSITTTTSGNLTLYAKMTLTPYTITYCDGTTDITNLTPSTYTYGTGATLPTSYSKTGYTFNGWYSDVTLTKKVTAISATETGNKTYYAKTTPNTYTITYYDGSTKLTNLTPSTYTYGTGATLPTYSKTGYTLEGWYTDKNYTTKVTSISKTDTGNKTLYAKISPATYEIKYMWRGMQLTTLSPLTYTYGEGVSTLPVLEAREGHTFYGWYTDTSYTTKVTSIPPTATGTQTIHAKETPNTYTITYYDGDTKITTLTPTSYVYAEDRIDLPYYSKEGHIFLGWYTSPTLEYETKKSYIGGSDIGDKTFYLGTRLEWYKINYYDGDQLMSGLDINGYNYSVGVSSLPIPTKEGYTFEGWYTSPTFEEETKVNSIAPTEMGEKTFYSKWTVNKYTITWANGDGSVIYEEELEYGTLPVYDEATYGIPTYQDHKYIYKFLRWGSITKVTGDKTYIPSYDIEAPVTYNISYYVGNVKIEGLEPSTYSYGTPTGVPRYEVDGYTKDGWYTSPTFEEETKWHGISSTDYGDKVFYLKLIPNTYVIRYYDVTYGYVDIDNLEPTSYTYGVGTELPIYEKEGYTFEGWYTNRDDVEGSMIERITETDFNNKYLYAKLTPNTYNIKYYDGTTEITNLTPSTYTYGTPVSMGRIPSYKKDGYLFGGWYTSPTFEEETKLTEGITKTDLGDKVLYAKMTPNTYTITYYEKDIYSLWDEITTLTPTTYIVGIGAELPEYEREQHTFEGWYTSPTFEEDTKVEKITETDFADKKLYAKLIPNTYEITYYYGETKLEGLEPTSHTYGISTYLPIYELEGYTFNGWYRTSTFDGTAATYIYMFDSGDKVLYAKMTINEYTISFEENEGTEVPDITAEYNSAVTKPVDPTKEGYTFDGWYSDEALENAYEFTTMPLNGIKLYAKWNVNQYTITFEENGGTDVEDITADYNSVVTKPVDPTREHYTFGGWYIDEELTTPYEFSVMPSENVTLYAKWIGDPHTITWLNVDGTELLVEQVEYGTLPVYKGENPAYTKDGYTYTFKGWDKEITEVIGDTTYIAEYDETVNEYEITYYYGETKLEGIAPNTYVYGIGTELQPHTVEGYTFEGWYTSPTFEEDTKLENISTTDFGDKVLYANMVINQYTITFEENEGTEVTDITGDFGAEVTKPENPTKDGYTFDNWYSDETLENVYEFTTMPAENITLYAKWNANQYTIIFEENGGEEVEDITADYNSPVEAPTAPTREHYTFDNWYIDEELTTPYEFSIMPLDGITLYAKWIGDLHTITWSNIDGTEIYNEQVEYGILPVYDETTYGVPKYEVDGYTYTFKGWDKEVVEVTGDVTYKATYSEEVNTYNIEYYYGQLKLEGIEPTSYVYGIGTELQPHEVVGYTFNGWYTSSTFEEDTKVESITTTDFGDKVLYANMVINQYTISFEENEGTEVTDITGDFGAEVTKPENPTKEGYTFDNWYSDETLENVYEFTTMPAENITLYAKWNANQYTIIFEENGGEEVEDITADYNSPVEAPTAPTREHYTFDNWYIDEELTTPYEFSIMPLDGITLYAKWIGDLHTITWSNIDGTEIYNEQVEYGTLPVYDETTYGVPKYEVDGYTYTFTGWDPEVTEVTGDTTYTATYSETTNSYEITYYYGATKLEGIEPTSYVYGIGTELQPHVEEGYTFNGWYTSPTFEEDTKVERISTTDFGDKVLYANMVINQYTISFEENEGTEVTDITGDFGTEVTKPEDPIKDGYTFGGWYSDEELNTPYVFTTMPAENITVYAKWNVNQYTISFEENGGTEVEDITADYNSTVTKPVDPTKEHYTFDAWYIDPELTQPYEFSVMPLNGITLYAAWIGDLHTITWSNIDGTEIYTEQVEYGKLPVYDETTYGVPTYTKDGYTYTFTGWDKEVTEVTGDVTYTATYSEEVNTYNITYYYGETKLEGIEPTSYVYGTETELQPHVVEGYRFEGWYTSETFEEDTKVESITTTDFGDKVLYAKMVRNEFTITFEENGGSEVEDITKTAGEEITAPTTTRDGYVFDGWYSDIDLTNPYEFSVMPEENITLYAKWSEITIEVLNKDIVMFVDDEEQIEITTTPEDAVLTFNYTPSTDIISVSEEGLIKGLTDGEATITVKVLENPNIEEVITVKVHSKEIESETYSVEQKEDVKIIIGMDEGVTIEELLETLSNNKDHINVYDKDGNKLDDYTKVVSTGLNIKLETEDKVYDEVKVILRGDIDGDGIINVTDEAILSEHILFISTIEDYTKYAADIVVDDIIDVTDDSVLTEYILKMIPTLN